MLTLFYIIWTGQKNISKLQRAHNIFAHVVTSSFQSWLHNSSTLPLARDQIRYLLQNSQHNFTHTIPLNLLVYCIELCMFIIGLVLLCCQIPVCFPSFIWRAQFSVTPTLELSCLLLSERVQSLPQNPLLLAGLPNHFRVPLAIQIWLRLTNVHIYKLGLNWAHSMGP